MKNKFRSHTCFTEKTHTQVSNSQRLGQKTEKKKKKTVGSVVSTIKEY